MAIKKTKTKKQSLVLRMEDVGIKDVALVGGKNASLGEMIVQLKKKGIDVPSGFIVTAEAYRLFIRESGLNEFIKDTLKGLNTHDVRELAKRGSAIRSAIKAAPFPDELDKEIREAYKKMERKYSRRIDVAVRSSATAEDLPGASFAGEHETYLGIRGADNIIKATQAAMASLFTNRAISYRVDKGFAHEGIALSVGVQRMVRSDLGSSGVMFTVDTESGFKDVVLINAVWGLGEMIVQGRTTPDEYLVYKPSLSDKKLNPIIERHLGAKRKKMVYSGSGGKMHGMKILSTSDTDRAKFVLTEAEILKLSRWGAMIEEHYSKHHGHWTPMDMEWAKDGKDGKLYIVQARPETVQAGRDYTKVKEYKLKDTGRELTRGISVGSAIASGKARVIFDTKHISSFKPGEVLVTSITDPDWEPIMKIASAIVTDRGGRTSHAAIVSRELGIPAIVGTSNATKRIRTGKDVTIDTTGSEGVVYEGKLGYDVKEHNVTKLPDTKTHIMMNIGMPEAAFEKSFIPNKGVGLAREEFIIASHIGVHPMALLYPEKTDPRTRAEIEERTKGWKDNAQFYVDNLAYGIAKIASAFAPNPVIVRFSDFKTNEYRTLVGGEHFEPFEENPMIGWRGASRYYDPKFREAFLLEVKAMRKVREQMGLKNVIPMIPFCRTIDEAEKVLATMARGGIITNWTAKKGRGAKKQNITPVYMMCEVPSNVILADEFLDRFDGFSIGSNDLTQLALGLDRDSELISHVADENNEAVKLLIKDVIAKCKKRKKYIGICGQAPSDHPEFAAFLVEHGIESMSLTPDSIIKTTAIVANKEKAKRKNKL